MRYLTLLSLLFLSFAANAAEPTLRHGMAMQGEAKYKAGFKHFDYVNPDAPKGGMVRLAAIGTFDNLNAYILKGVAATGMELTFDTLLESSADEAFSEYGLLAESMEVPEDRSWVIFHLRPEAKFRDGTAVTAQDVVFTYETLKTKGTPNFRLMYGSVQSAEAMGDCCVKFTFAKGDNRELPLVVGQMPVLSKNYYENVEFNQTTLDAPMGSGPYRVKTVDAGRSITYERDPDYWGKDLPVNKGRYNFDTIRYDYYRDGNIALEAFKAGDYDFRSENVAKEWATAYDFPALQQGIVKKEEIQHELPTGMQGFMMNTRRALFQDPQVRQALGYAFDFEWTNKTIFYGSYTRTRSYFSNSELASKGLPSADELKILNKYKDLLPEEVFTTEYNPPKTDGSGNIRENLKAAQKLLEEAGWKLQGERLMKDGQAFEFEILSNQPTFDRVLLPFRNNLQKLGIKATIRNVDSSQYEKRMQDFDYDMTILVIPQSLSPGNEQRGFWSSKAADTKGSNNYVGIKSPVVDDLVELVISSPDREQLITRTHALDRVLLAGYYVIPNWHIKSFRVAYWDMFDRPAVRPKYALGFLDTWWLNDKKRASLEAAKGGEGGKTVMPRVEERGMRGLWVLVALMAILLLIFAVKRKK